MDSGGGSWALQWCVCMCVCGKGGGDAGGGGGGKQLTY